MTEDKKCKHQTCPCQAAEDSDHCSEYCESIGDGDTLGSKCQCGHPGCE